MSSDPVPPRQEYQPAKQISEEEQDLRKYSNSARGGRSGGTAIAIGAVMLIAGIGLSAAGTGRVFIGLIVVGIINIVRGLAA